MMYLMLLVGFVLLIVGSDVFVDGSSAIAKLLKIPSLIIGLTIVSIGTSLPEASVSITASLAGNSGISVGNIVGSNIFNCLIVLGISASMYPFFLSKIVLKRDMLWNISTAFALLMLVADGVLNRCDGALLLACFAGYILTLYRAVRDGSADEDNMSKNVIENKPIGSALSLMIVGLTSIILGGNFVVENASKIAAAWGMSDTLIGLTIVAAGTSLPELATSIIAARKGEAGIAVGNAIGSCILNVLFILGVSAFIAPLAVSSELIIDTGVMAVVGCLVYFFARSGMKFSRLEGMCCVLAYVAYSAYAIIR